MEKIVTCNKSIELVWTCSSPKKHLSSSFGFVLNLVCRKNGIKKSKQVLKELLQKNWGWLILLLILLKLSLSPSNIWLKNIFQLNWNIWLKSYIKHGNKLIILYHLLIVSSDRGKPIRDPTGLIQFFLQKMGSVLKISLSIEYHTKSNPPLVGL